MKNLLKTTAVSFMFTLLGCGQTTTVMTEMNGFEADVDSLMQLYHTVGTSVAIVKDGKMMYAKGFGYSNLEEKIPADENTIFGIGSCTKAFTAALFGILEEDGKLSLEDKPSKHIPELQFYTSEMDEKINLKHILSHATGLSQLSTESSAVFFRSDDRNVIIPRLKYLKPQAQAGEAFIYNNYIYALAGRIIEHITKTSWEENLTEMIFKPLEMNGTYANGVPASTDSDFALGYGVMDSIPARVLVENFPTRDAGGNIYSSVVDMSKWLTVWMNEGKFNNKQFLTESFIEKATGEQQLMHTDSVTGQSYYYGFGWMRGAQEGHTTIEHSGGVSGYTSNVVYFPDDSLGIIVLSNQNTAGISNAITDNLKKRLLAMEITPNPNEPYFSRMYVIADPNTNTIINENAPPTNALEDMTGNFYHPGFGTIVVSYTDNTLHAKVPFTTFRLEHQHDNVFHDQFTERKSQVVGNFLNFNFQANIAGVIDGVLLNVDQEPVLFRRK